MEVGAVSLQAPIEATLTEGGIVSEVGVHGRQWRLFWSSPTAIAGAVMLAFVILFSFVGPLVWRQPTDNINLAGILQPPTWAHPLGTDSLGRDMLVRLMVGGQVSLIVGFAAALVSMVIGVAYGMLSGILGGVADVVLMRIVDALFAIPTLFLLLLVDALFPPSATLLTVVLASTSWFGVTRLVRAEVLSLRTRDYVEAARACGAGTWRIMWRHLLPNVVGVITVTTTFQVGGVILTVAALSFLGLGLPPPAPNWGELLSDSMNYIFQGAWWLMYPPGLMIVIVEIAVNFLGDALRQAYDPRLLGV
jgi:peptide/nickel transport system permease protein